MKQNMGTDRNHIKRSPAIKHMSNSSCDVDSEICSNAEFPVYTVQIPPTPDNQMFCDVTGCVSNDVHVTVLSPCECGFKICRECYSDVLFSGEALCPRCKRLYRRQEEFNPCLSVTKSRKTMVKSKVNEFDHDGKFLFDDGRSTDRDTVGVGDSAFKQWKPLTRRINISAAVIAPYRLLIVVRMVVLGLFIYWRLTNPNEVAIWLWGMSVVCEIWFSFSWLLDQLPKLCPINRAANLDVLKQMFESNPAGKSDLPGIDVFVSIADPEKEPPLITANTILSILAADYPVEKLSCYVSDDGGALLTFEAMAEAASFANVWVPFCRKHEIEPRNPESYFSLKRDPYKNKVRSDFVSDRRRVKHEYDEFKVRINGLSESIRRCSDAYNTQDELKAMKRRKEARDDEVIEEIKVRKATWMGNGTHWPGAWMVSVPEHTRADHASILQILLQPPSDEPQKCKVGEGNSIDLSEVDIRLPMLVYVSREKRPGYDHNKKAGAMNALVRASAVMSNGAFILNLDCDQYIYNSQALREGMCYMMDQDGESICYVQFPQRFEGIDPFDRYANHNNVFFDVNMRALDGIQGPVCVGTGCLFRRVALYGIDPPLHKEQNACCESRSGKAATIFNSTSKQSHEMEESDSEEMNTSFIPRTYGNSDTFLESIATALYESLPLADQPLVKKGRAALAILTSRNPLTPSVLNEALNVISCWYEDKTEWGQRVGWIYGSVTEDIVTGYRMHKRGWRSVYCVTKRDAFRGTAPINLTNRLHQVLRWATGSVEIFFSRNNAILAGPKLKLLQRIAYINISIYPFTSIFLIVYCFLPALSLFTNQFIVQSLSINFLAYLLIMTLTLCALAILEIKWSGTTLEEWWRNEQFWLIGGTSAHLIAVIQGLLKAIAGIDISFTLKSKSSTNDSDVEFEDLYVFKWTSLMIPPCVIIMLNLIGIAIAVSRNVYSNSQQWSKFIGGTFFSFCVLAHLYPFAKGLIRRKGKTPTVVFVWSGLISICISLLWVAINPPSGSNRIGAWFQFL